MKLHASRDRRPFQPATYSYGQTYLADELRSLLNSSGSWCALTYGLVV
jgi:hypothetical protein